MRAIRRHHYTRLKKKRKNYWGNEYTNPIVYETPKCCSCCACGNPRKHWKAITKQEYIANIITREYEKEYRRICDTSHMSLGYW